VKLLFATLFISTAFFLYLSFSTAKDQTKPLDFIAQTYEQTSSTTINKELSSSSTETTGRKFVGKNNPNKLTIDHQPQVNNSQYNNIEYTNNEPPTIMEADSGIDEDTLDQQPDLERTKPELPGEEVNFLLKLHSSTHHMIEGKATSDIGKIVFKCRLMPSNEVKLSMKFKQNESENVELLAYVDLANFTLELDGSNSTLTKDHKQLLKFASSHLESKFETQYKDYDAPEHALVLLRMIAYWSVSPEGYVHEKRSIVSQ